MITPHPHQSEFIDNIRAEMPKHRIITAQLSTGGGKSVVASAMIKAAMDKGNTCAFIVPRVDLLTQMSATFDKFGITHSFIASGKSSNPYVKAHICSAGTLVNRLHNPCALVEVVAYYLIRNTARDMRLINKHHLWRYLV